jgi:hypothetical protein
MASRSKRPRTEEGSVESSFMAERETKVAKRVPELTRFDQYHQGMDTAGRTARTFDNHMLAMPPLHGVSPIKGTMSLTLFRAIGDEEVAALEWKSHQPDETLILPLQHIGETSFPPPCMALF